MKKRVIIIAAIVLMLACIGSRFHIRTIDYQKVVLFHNPFEHGSSSARADILKAFDENGKSSERVKEIFYIGSTSEGVFYLCKYVEENGNETEYYAFDDNDINSTVRAKVFWTCSIPE